MDMYERNKLEAGKEFLKIEISKCADRDKIDYLHSTLNAVENYIKLHDTFLSICKSEDFETSQRN